MIFKKIPTYKYPLERISYNIQQIYRYLFDF
jgi:hypothetical protein